MSEASFAGVGSAVPSSVAFDNNGNSIGYVQ